MRRGRATPIQVDDGSCRRQVDRASGKGRHGDEILPTDDFRSGIRKTDLPRAVQEFGVHAAQTEQEVHSTAVAILDFEQPRNRFVRVTARDSGLLARLDERMSKRLRFADMQYHDRVCI